MNLLPPTWREVLPTHRQIETLRKLGVFRTPQTKAEAYRLIEEAFNKKGSSYERPAYSHR
jgi:hypothetical protein